MERVPARYVQLGTIAVTQHYYQQPAMSLNIRLLVQHLAQLVQQAQSAEPTVK